MCEYAKIYYYVEGFNQFSDEAEVGKWTGILGQLTISCLREYGVLMFA
jgi:hypothetical protein